jgi:large subunit ribosomal protein L17
MVTSLFKHQRIRTTDVKAKELRRWADNLITLAKRGDLHARRQALSIVREKEVVHKLFAEAAELYGGRSGGYTRIIKLGRRPGDAAPISLIELISEVDDKKKKTKKKKKKKAKALIDKKIVEEKKADEDKSPEVEEEKDETTVDQVKPDDKAALLESDTIPEDTDEKVKDENLEPAESAETEQVEDEVKESPKKTKDTESKT